ncbi:lipoate--protein ligase family protein [Thermoflexus sp.]|uniref:lipoate--protein ligase family protein n=2 Tax=Thermoflexus sp. TaxID=1969742 RepID=UPI0025E53AA5|nr:lipoate--protein ligase family protein [Thermoflexus sp.]MCS6963741.1 lipoate--protein ligase family protein [Thermoflexus sp.]MCX7689732.1 lipoate--protein ligase family protein [Thermoflexus sp.]MDW8184847.1 lipoate--protein ligase family protein [Anaerolineae bacterium]
MAEGSPVSSMSSSLPRWRLLWSPPADGATHMAIDVAMVEAVAEGKAPPTVRFYCWEPPCLSLGRRQSVSEVDLQRCQAEGVEVVRRPTGGRAILHANELTYSVVFPETDLRAMGGVLETFRRFSEAFAHALRALGVSDVALAPRLDPVARGSGFVCFEVPTDYELTVNGRKIMGSAQWRHQGVVLQHGSLPLAGDPGAIARYLKNGPDPERLRRRTITLQEAAGRPVAFEEAAAAILEAFRSLLAIETQPGGLTPEEQARIPEWRERLSVLRRSEVGSM